VLILQLYFLFTAMLRKDNNAFILFIVYALYIFTVIFEVISPNLGVARDSISVNQNLLMISLTELIVFIVLTGRETIKIYRERNRLMVESKNHQVLLTKKILETQEVERSKIGGDLHDMIGANLSIIKQNVNKENSALEKLIDDTIDTVRRISHGLLSPSIKSTSFEDQIKDLCLLFNSEEMRVNYFFNQWELVTDQETITHIYRIVQELLQNASKHSEAKQVYLQFYATGEAIEIMYEDNGIGLQENNTAGHGLANIKNRVKLCEGTVRFDSKTNKGLSVLFTFKNKPI
jgi:signal transduction histidine kinase